MNNACKYSDKNSKLKLETRNSEETHAGLHLLPHRRRPTARRPGSWRPPGSWPFWISPRCTTATPWSFPRPIIRTSWTCPTNSGRRWARFAAGWPRPCQLSLKAQGFNIGMNNFDAAGQEVFHAHVHVIPRYFGDGLQIVPPGELSARGYGEDRGAAAAGPVGRRLKSVADTRPAPTEIIMLLMRRSVPEPPRIC